jgi:hypothetical protein
MAGTKVQSVILAKNQWSKSDADKWVEKKKFKVKKVDETSNFYRYRQTEPKKSKNYRWKPFSEKKGIYSVVEVPKGRK